MNEFSCKGALFDGAAWIASQVERYGPIASAEALRELLGCRTTSALNHALTQGEFGFATFTLPKRRGQFAFTSEVAAWLVEQREYGASRPRLGRLDGQGEREGERAASSAQGSQ